MSQTYDVIVVGGGASGMIAAGRAAELGNRVLLLEKNKRLGEKLRITGGGRCNITNAESDKRILLSAYGKADKFLHSLFDQFGVAETFSFFETRNLQLVTEARKRVFPVSQRAGDVVTVLQRYMLAGGVDVRTRTSVTTVNHEANLIKSVQSGQEIFTAKKYIFATGGVSHPETGSTGDGLNWLRELGHKVIEPTPSIVPLAVSSTWAKEIPGITLQNCRITFYLDGTKQFRLDGDILFTHFGISGPLILNNAHRVADLLQNGEVTAVIDARKDLDSGALDSLIVKVFDENKNKSLKNILGLFIPSGMQKGIMTLLSEFTEPDTKVHSVSREQRKQITRLLKELPLTIDGLMGFDKAVVADGGVVLEEVDTRTLQSLKVENLYITGDLLNIRRPSGGYSLQLCWSSGYVAGSN